MTDSKINGSCLCGAVRFEVQAPFTRMVHCHCTRCRKATGTGHATNLIAPPAQFTWLSGEEILTHYDLPTAKSFSKWFCKNCGAPMPRLTRDGQRMIIPAGSLDSAPQMQPSDHIFWSSRAPWACESSGIPTHDEYPESWK